VKILITGGAGFIGSHIVEYFQNKAEIVILDNLRSGNINNIKGMKYQLIEGDIRDRTTVRKAVKDIDYIFHLAAMVSVPESMDKPTECIDINVTGTVILLEEAAKANVKKLSFSSSCSVYGNNPIIPKKEIMLPEPQSPYAISKLDGEYYAELFSSQKKLKTVCLRYFNVFGPRQNPNNAYAAAVPIFINKALKHDDLTIYGDGEQTRDFVYVKDVVSANIFMIENDFSGIYNIGYGKTITIKSLADKIITQTGSNSRINFTSQRSGDVKHSRASIDKLLKTGFESLSSFDNALNKTIKYFKTN
jgi:UDP-glucose 4-epimerase